MNDAGCPRCRLNGSLSTQAATAGESASRTRDAAIGRVSLAVGEVCAIDLEPLAKARMLRELAVWYRALATQAANAVIWESRLLTAEDLDTEARRLERQAGQT